MEEVLLVYKTAIIIYTGHGSVHASLPYASAGTFAQLFFLKKLLFKKVMRSIVWKQKVPSNNPGLDS